MIESTYSCSSFSGLVSSKRRLVLPPNSAASPKLRQMDLAWPMCRYPLGSGGKRVCTRPLNLLVFRSSRTMSRTKFDGRSVASAGVVAAVSSSRADVDMIALPKEGRHTAYTPQFAENFILRGEERAAHIVAK